MTGRASDRICSVGRFLRTGFPHLWGLGPSVGEGVCTCMLTPIAHKIMYYVAHGRVYMFTVPVGGVL